MDKSQKVTERKSGVRIYNDLPAISCSRISDGREYHRYGRVSLFFFSSRRRHTRSVSAFLLNRSSDLDNPNALRDYFRDIGRMVLAAEGRKANDSHADCYQYFCVPEYGTANGRLHFHAVHFMRTLPTGSVDPNFGRRVRNR